MREHLASFDVDAFIKTHTKKSTRRRAALLKKLATKPWFQASSSKVQDEIAQLPQTGLESHDGFIEDLIARPSDIGDISIIRMISLPRGYYTLCPIFEVENRYSKRTYTYEYAAMRQGVPAGVKGLVLVRPKKDAEPTHFIILKGEEFATASQDYDLIGGMPKESGSIENNVIREIRDETGVRTLQVEDITILDTIAVDPGVTSHRTTLFVAFLSTKEAKKISTHAKNIDDTEMNTYVHTMSIKEISRVVKETNNGLVLSAISKMMYSGILKTPISEEKA